MVVNKDTNSFLLWLFKASNVMLVALVPLIVQKNVFFPFVVPRATFLMVVISVLLLIWVSLRYFNPDKYFWPWQNLIWLTAFGFLVVSFVSGLLGTDFGLSFFSSYQRMTGLLMLSYLVLWLGVNISVLAEAKTFWKKLLAVFVWVSAMTSVYTVLGPHGLGVFDFLDISRGGATFGNTSFMATYLLFAVFLGLFVIFDKTEKKVPKWQKWLWLPLFFIVINPLFLNLQRLTTQAGLAEIANNPLALVGEARAVAVAIPIGLFFVLAMYLARQKRNIAKVVGGFLSLGVVTALVSGAFLLLTSGTGINRWFGEMASKSRFLIWDKAIGAFLERPLLGWGPESFDLVQQKLFDPLILTPGYSSELWFDRAHNIVVDTLFSTGVLGLVTYIGMFIGMFIVVYQLRKRGQISDLQSAVLGGLAVAYVLQNLTVFDMPTSYFAFFLLLALVGAWSKVSLLKQEANFSKLFVSLGMVSIGTMALIGLFAFVFPVYKSAWYVSNSVKGELRSDQRLSYYEKAFNSPISRTLFLQNISSQVYDFMKSLDLAQASPAFLENTKREAAFFEQALAYEAERLPYNYRAYYSASRMAHLQAVLGDVEKVNDAFLYLEQAQKINNTNPLGYMALVDFYLFVGQIDKARLALDEMIALAPSSVMLQDFYIQSSVAIDKVESGLYDE